MTSQIIFYFISENDHPVTMNTIQIDMIVLLTFVQIWLFFIGFSNQINMSLYYRLQ
jgi:hypothetical protein